jgi:hypothetical protein
MDKLKIKWRGLRFKAVPTVYIRVFDYFFFLCLYLYSSLITHKVMAKSLLSEELQVLFHAALLGRSDIIKVLWIS